ncbi:MAG: hypothetical protein Q9M17_10855 [Mariprofundus sp.]|nr:hypothetical protein [Mariprofundus sp.]
MNFNRLLTGTIIGLFMSTPLAMAESISGTYHIEKLRGNVSYCLEVAKDALEIVLSDPYFHISGNTIKIKSDLFEDMVLTARCHSDGDVYFKYSADSPGMIEHQGYTIRSFGEYMEREIANDESDR